MRILNVTPSSEAVIDSQGVYRQLVFVSVDSESGFPENTQITLRRTTGHGQDVKHTVAAVKGGAPLRLGFWVPVEPEEAGSEIRIDLIAGSPAGAERGTAHFVAPPINPFPLRLDRLGLPLKRRIEAHAWRGDCFAGARFTADMQSYLVQHEVIYRQPVDHWADGLLIGNGDFGGMITGGGRFEFWMQKSDLWAVDPHGTGTGRCWGALLALEFGRAFDPETDRFEDRLSLYEGRVVRTWTGARWQLSVSAYVHSRKNLARIRCSLQCETAAAPRIRLERPVHQFPGESSGTGSTSIVAAGARDREIWVTHTLPNMSYAVVASLRGPHGQGAHQQDGCGAESSIAIEPSRAFDFEILVGIVTDREDSNPIRRARRIAREGTAIDPKSDELRHRTWWKGHWDASFVSLSDKFAEHAYYCGAYQQAVVSRAQQAISFLGLSYMRDSPPWMDGYTTDAQVPLMWWSIYPANRLELGYNYMHTFLSMVPEFIEHSHYKGMEVPHQMLPLWAGGHGWVATTYPNPYRSSTPWLHLNFWRHYSLTNDLDFLRDHLYPLMCSAARYGIGIMSAGDDGRLHILDSHSPEQNGTSRDPAIDCAMFRALFDHLIEAAEVLDDAQETKDLWQETRDHIFDYPQDSESICEADRVCHPYRCHPSVFAGVYPAGEVTPDHPLWEKFKRTFDVTTDLVAYRGRARHEAFPDYHGGFEPVAFTAGWLAIVAARLDLPERSRELFVSPFLRFCLKPNGQIALADLRQKDWTIGRAALVEGANVLCAAIHEWLIQDRRGVLHLFPGVSETEDASFANLRTRGAFLLSAEKRDTRLLYFSVRALEDGTWSVRNPWGDTRVRIEEISSTDHTETQSGNVLSRSIRRGEIHVVTEASGVIPAWRDIPMKRLDGERMAGPRILPLAQIHACSQAQRFYPCIRGSGQIIRNGDLCIGMPEVGPRSEIDPMARLHASSEHWQRVPDPEGPGDAASLKKAVRSSNWRNRQDALRRLGTLSPLDVATLSSSLLDPHPMVRRTAMASLARGSTAEGRFALARFLLLAKDSGDRAEALRLLGDRRLVKKVETSGG